MFRKVLVGLDGSEASWRAFRSALDLAAEHGGELWTLSVEDHLPRFAGTVGEVVEEEQRENTYFAEVQERARRIAEEQGVAFHGRTVAGNAAERLVELARAGGFDLIVVGHRGHSNPWHQLVGGTADRLVDHAPCSVLVDRQPVRTAERVVDAMTHDVTRVRAHTPAAELVRLLVGQGFRALPVVDDAERVVGIVTGGDLLERGGLRARVDVLAVLDPDGLRRELEAVGRTNLFAGDVMSAPVATARPDEHLREAAHRMVARRLKRLPVVDVDGRLVGMVSRADVLRVVGEASARPEPAPSAVALSRVRTIGELARADVPTVGPDADLPEVLDAVVSTRLLRAVVVDQARRVLGVVSDADLVRHVEAATHPTLLQALAARLPFGRHAAEDQARLRATPARAADLMTSPAVTVAADTPLAEAIRTMLAQQHKILPVVDARERLAGAVDRADLLRAVALGGDAP
jgi:CBS domain-containing protein